MTTGTVAAGFVRRLIDVAVSRGATREDVMSRAGLNAADLRDADARIPFANYIAAMRAGSELSGDPALGLHFGAEVDLAEMSVIPLLENPSGTMDGALAALNRYSRIDLDLDGAPRDRFQLQVLDGRYWMIDGRPNPNSSPELTEAFFARW